jgi:hypothetical protein
MGSVQHHLHAVRTATLIGVAEKGEARLYFTLQIAL